MQVNDTAPIATKGGKILQLPLQRSTFVHKYRPASV